MDFLFKIMLFSALFFVGDACKGCVNLDEHNFNKIISRFKVVLVKFDMAYPYGEKHDVFVQFAEEIIENKNIIAAEVGVKDYGEKDNAELAKKFGINSKDDMPALRLFTNGVVNDAKEFPTKNKWDVNSIREFVKANSEIYIGLPGCSEEMDQLTMDFIKSEDKNRKFDEIEKISKSMTEKEKDVAATYLKYMRKIVLEGLTFVTNETKRLKKLLKESNIQDKKKRDLSNRLNILKSFSSTQGLKEEL